jgi:hypothetical protein
MRTAILLAALAVVCGGCTPSIHRQFSVEDDPPTSLSIDAKQRVAWVLKRQTPAAGARAAAASPTDRIICAEPSPDAMVGIAAALGLDVPFRGGSIGFEGKLAEAVAQMGTRTQTIQLLRDGLYRACEAYMNGVLDEADYETLLRHYDSTMIMLVAVDGLTQGCGTAAAVSTRAEAPAGAAKPGAGGASVGATAQPAALTACTLSDKTVEKVADIMKQYFDYKAPVQRRHCIRQTIASLSGGRGTASKSAAELASLLAVAKEICGAS